MWRDRDGTTVEYVALVEVGSGEIGEVSPPKDNVPATDGGIAGGAEPESPPRRLLGTAPGGLAPRPLGGRSDMRWTMCETVSWLFALVDKWAFERKRGSLFSRGEVLNLMNVYSDDQHTAIEHLAARVHSLPPFIYMAGDFNCVSTTWDDYDHGELSTAISLQDTASQISLEWARPSNHGPTRISPNPNQRSNVLDLVFLAPSEILISMPRLEHNLQGPSDHVPICTDLDIGPEPPGSGEAEKSFILDILRDLAAILVAALAIKEGVEALADAIASAFSDVWLAHSTESKPTKRSKSWWTDECSETFGVYQLSRSLTDYNKFKKQCSMAARSLSTNTYATQPGY
ncbi:unnamed protein product [Cyclocybe aegerita]|uniref:Endonuclease/exonuclease/phosphatase domain-containing protein n=1 Tax=Cyclocybe aegerita TaxID=1973307 RepID=A0A8S0VRE7_CYCAE|nr:unnamed protein product [Cyclocybe aegerita]